MYTLCLDTSYKYLAIVLYKDDEYIDSYEALCERSQSEQFFTQLVALLDKNHIAQEDIQKIVVTKGPGSYTGVRIAMTFAKIVGAMKNVEVYTISTLALYQKHDAVILDAKGGKVFFRIDKDCWITLEEAKQLSQNMTVDGDSALVDQQEQLIDFKTQFIAKKSLWEKVDEIDALVPLYLKEAI